MSEMSIELLKKALPDMFKRSLNDEVLENINHVLNLSYEIYCDFEFYFLTEQSYVIIPYDVLLILSNGANEKNNCYFDNVAVE